MNCELNMSGFMGYFQIFDPPYAATHCSIMLIRRSCSALSIAIFCSCSMFMYIPNSHLAFSGALANAFPWPWHASPVNTGAEHFSILAFHAQQQWTEAKRHVMAKEHAMAGASEVQGGVRNEDDGAWTEDGNGQGRAWPADEHYAAVCGSIWWINNFTSNP